MKRIIAIVAIALALSILVISIGIPEAGDVHPEPDRIAPRALNIVAILPLSGDDMDLGTAQQYGISRGVLQPRDQPINLHILDSRGDPDHAVSILRERRSTHAIHGLIVSGTGCVLAVSPYAEKWGIPMAAIAAPRQPEAEGGRSRISFTPPIAAEIDALAPFISGYSDIAFFYPDSEEGREMADSIRNIPAVHNPRLIGYAEGREDYLDLVRPLHANPPEIFIMYGDRDVPAIISAIRSRGANPIILLWEEGSIMLLEEAPELAEGVFLLAPATNQDHPIFGGVREQPFLMAPGTVAEAYDAAHTLSNSLATCLGDMECVAGWFWNRDHAGALGTIRFNERREASYTYEIQQIREGAAEPVGLITAPGKTVSIRVITGSSDGWFASEVRKGSDAALTVINQQTNIGLPLAQSTGIPSLFDARVGILYDADEIPDGSQLIGTVTITPDGRTRISGGGADPEREIGIDTEAYIGLCFDILDRNRDDGQEGVISLFYGQPDDPLIMIARAAAEARGYRIGADIQYEEAAGISPEIDLLKAESPKSPLFVSARTPAEAAMILSHARRAEYSPEMIFTLGDAWKSGSFLRGGGVFSDGIIAGSVYRRESLDQFQAIRSVNSLMVRQSGQELNDITARSFTGVMMVADGAERAGSADRASIHAAIRAASMTPDYGALYDGATYLVQMRSGAYRAV